MQKATDLVDNCIRRSRMGSPGPPRWQVMGFNLLKVKIKGLNYGIFIRVKDASLTALLSDTEEEIILVLGSIANHLTSKHMAWQITLAAVWLSTHRSTTMSCSCYYSTSTCLSTKSHASCNFGNFVRQGKRKETCFSKALRKNTSPGLGNPFQLDVSAQLANILTYIIMHKLFQLSKDTKALQDDHWPASLFHQRVHLWKGINTIDPYILHRTHRLCTNWKDLSRPCVCPKHQSKETTAIPQHPPISLVVDNYYTLRFHANNSHLLSRIHFKCQFGNLKIEVTCCTIDLKPIIPLNNLLLGGQRIHPIW